MHIVPTNRFIKKAARLPKNIREAYKERVQLFTSSPYDPLLNNHRLHGERRHQRSINITGDWRLIFEQYDANTVRLIDIDTHPNLYGT